MSLTYMESRNATAGHEVLRGSGIVICYRQGRQFGRPVADDLLHRCPFCSEQVYTFA
jgi:hypothetical protein